eukprot:364915-Chlamydomonas_euryale.AAC.34
MPQRADAWMSALVIHARVCTDVYCHTAHRDLTPHCARVSSQCGRRNQHAHSVLRGVTLAHTVCSGVIRTHTMCTRMHMCASTLRKGLPHGHAHMRPRAARVRARVLCTVGSCGRMPTSGSSTGLWNCTTNGCFSTCKRRQHGGSGGQ